MSVLHIESELVMEYKAGIRALRDLGDDPTPDEEDPILDRLDWLWWEMSPEETDEARAYCVFLNAEEDRQRRR